MKTVSRFALSSLTAAMLVATTWAMPARTANPDRQSADQTPQVQSVSGQIASVDNASFTITLAGTAKIAQDNAAASPKTMSFTIDQNTTIDGKLKVGSNADVTYRQANGNNVAVSVHVN